MKGNRWQNCRTIRVILRSHNHYGPIKIKMPPNRLNDVNKSLNGLTYQYSMGLHRPLGPLICFFFNVKIIISAPISHIISISHIQGGLPDYLPLVSYIPDCFTPNIPYDIPDVCPPPPPPLCRDVMQQSAQ